MAADAYDELTGKLQRAHLLSTVDSLLNWDEQVNLPPDSASLRAEQMALMAEMHHAAAGDASIGGLLGKLEAQRDTLSDDQRVVLHHARRDYDRVTKLPADFVREKAALISRAYHAWAEARAKSDFAGYA